MNHRLFELFKTRLLAGGLFALSSCGTLALFSLMPVVAQRLSAPASPSLPNHAAERQPDGWFSRQPLRLDNRS